MKGLYEEYQLLELFDDYKIIDREVKIVEFEMLYDKNMIFNLHISTYESTAIVTLTDNDTKSIIFSIGLKKLEKIVCKDGNLFFFKEQFSDKPILIAQIKPTLSLDCDL